MRLRATATASLAVPSEAKDCAGAPAVRGTGQAIGAAGRSSGPQGTGRDKAPSMAGRPIGEASERASCAATLGPLNSNMVSLSEPHQALARAGWQIQHGGVSIAHRAGYQPPVGSAA